MPGGANTIPASRNWPQPSSGQAQFSMANQNSQDKLHVASHAEPNPSLSLATARLRSGQLQRIGQVTPPNHSMSLATRSQKNGQPLS